MAKCQEQHRNQSCAAIRKAPNQVTITSEWKTLRLAPRIMKELCLSWARNFVHYVEYFKIFHWNSIFEDDGLIYYKNIYVYIIHTRFCRWYNHLFVGMICNYLSFNHIRITTVLPFNYLSFNLSAQNIPLICLKSYLFFYNTLLEDRLHIIHTPFNAIIIIFNTSW